MHTNYSQFQSAPELERVAGAPPSFVVEGYR